MFIKYELNSRPPVPPSPVHRRDAKVFGGNSRAWRNPTCKLNLDDTDSESIRHRTGDSAVTIRRRAVPMISAARSGRDNRRGKRDNKSSHMPSARNARRRLRIYCSRLGNDCSAFAICFCTCPVVHFLRSPILFCRGESVSARPERSSIAKASNLE